MIIKTCVVCGAAFRALGTSKTCSKKCSIHYKKNIYGLEYQRQYRVKNKERLRATYHEERDMIRAMREILNQGDHPNDPR
jgi:predicted nucleic acid-binding Zn ribbon protein